MKVVSIATWQAHPCTWQSLWESIPDSTLGVVVVMAAIAHSPKQCFHVTCKHVSCCNMCPPPRTTVHSSGASNCASAAASRSSQVKQPLTRGVGAAALARPAPTTTAVEASSAFFLPTSSARKPHEAAPRSMPTNTDDVSRDWLVGLSKPKLQDACKQTIAGGQCVGSTDTALCVPHRSRFQVMQWVILCSKHCEMCAQVLFIKVHYHQPWYTHCSLI